jgi:hypothetical protein
MAEALYRCERDAFLVLPEHTGGHHCALDWPGEERLGFGSATRGSDLAGTDRGVYCERCGTYLDLVAAVPVHSCPACHSIACQSCWNAPRRRCDGCAADAGAAAPRLRGGLARSLAVLRSLDELGSEVEALSEPRTADGAAPEFRDDLDLLLLAARITTLRDEADEALRRAPPRSAKRAADVRQRIETMATALEQRIAELQLGRLREPETVEDTVDRPAPWASWWSPARGMTVIHAAGAAVLLVAVAAVAFAPAAAPESFVPARPVETESPAEGVLGGDPAGGSAEATPAAADPTALVGATKITFDDLRMSADVGPEWRIERGERGQVGVAGFPSAVDRSLELSTSESGAGVAICRTMAVPIAQLGIDAWIESAESRLILAVESVAPDPRRSTWLLATHVGPGAAVDRTVRVTADGWYRFELVARAGADGAAWSVRPIGDGVRSSASVADGEVAMSELGELCVGIADGSPGARALIDDLTIGTRP